MGWPAAGRRRGEDRGHAALEPGHVAGAMSEVASVSWAARCSAQPGCGPGAARPPGTFVSMVNPGRLPLTKMSPRIRPVVFLPRMQSIRVVCAARQGAAGQAGWVGGVRRAAMADGLNNHGCQPATAALARAVPPLSAGAHFACPRAPHEGRQGPGLGVEVDPLRRRGRVRQGAQLRAQAAKRAGRLLRDRAGARPACLAR